MVAKYKNTVNVAAAGFGLYNSAKMPLNQGPFFGGGGGGPVSDLLYDSVIDNILSAGAASSPFNMDTVALERAVVEGELLLIVMASNSADVNTIGTPTGWTRALENPASNMSNFLMTRVAPAAFGTPLPIPLLSAGGQSYVTAQIAIPDGLAIDTVGATTEVTSATCTAAPITTSVDNCRLFAVFSLAGNQAVVTPPAGWDLVDSSTSGGFSIIGTHVFTKLQPTAGLSDAAACVFSASRANSGYQFAVSPK